MSNMHTRPQSFRCRWCEAADRGPLCRVVDSNVVVRLEKAHFANLLSADSRRSDVGDCSGRKFKSGIGGIDFVCKYGDSYGMQVRDSNVFANQPLHNVKVMDHEVEHHIYIERSRREFADAVNLKVHRVTNMRPQGHQCGVESFEVAYLQQSVTFLGSLDHSLCFSKCS